jgi:predicted F0F1-ATPase subunit
VKKSSDSPSLSRRRKSTSTGYTGKWPVPSTTSAGGTPEEQRARRASFWQTMVYLTSLGWLIALPIGLSVLLGRYLDDRLQSEHFWTLTLLGVGLGLAVLEVYLAGQHALRGKPHG